MTRAQAQKSPRDTLGEAKDKRQNQRTKARRHAKSKKQGRAEAEGFCVDYEIRIRDTAADKARRLS
jgi:hypothetical protein